MSGGAENNGKTRRRTLMILVRIAVSAVILTVVLKLISTGDVIEKLRGISPLVWCAAFALFLGGHAVSAAKWRWMIGGGLEYGRALRAHFAGLAANIALPGVAGGDVVRAGLVMRGSDRKVSLAVASLADRLIDTASLLLIAAGGGIWLGKDAGASAGLLVGSSIGLIALSVVGVALARPIAAFAAARAPTGKLGDFVRNAAEAASDLARRPRVLIGSLAVSLIVQTAFAATNWFLARSIGVETSLASWVFAWPLAKLVATLPISFGGIGVREASLAGLMVPLGAPASGVVAASLIWQSIQIASGVLGAAINLTGKERPASARMENSGGG